MVVAALFGRRLSLSADFDYSATVMHNVYGFSQFLFCFVFWFWLTGLELIS